MGRCHYRPQTKLQKGNVFTPVCQSFCSVHGGVSTAVHAGIYPPGQAPPPRQTPHWAGTPTPGQMPPTTADGYCCGRYASYWNAFLLNNFNSGLPIQGVRGEGMEATTIFVSIKFTRFTIYTILMSKSNHWNWHKTREVLEWEFIVDITNALLSFIQYAHYVQHFLYGS